MLKVGQYNEVIRFDLARTILGRGRYWTTAYFVDGLMIDTGCIHTAPELAKVLEKERVLRIVNTHSHEDHIGANGLLQRQHEALEILAYPTALPVLANPREAQPLQPYRRLLWGWPTPSRGKPVPNEAVIETENHRFRVIHTPGHSPDHICLYEPDRGWLFTGDLFVGGKERALRADYNIWEIIASLKQIAKLPATKLFPGSARVRENPSEALQLKISHLEDLGQRARLLHQQGKPVGAITRMLCGGFMPIELFTLGHFSRRNLIRSYLDKK